MLQLWNFLPDFVLFGICFYFLFFFFFLIFDLKSGDHLYRIFCKAAYLVNSGCRNC